MTRKAHKWWKKKIGQLDSSILKTLCLRGHNQEIEKTTDRMGEICANYVSGKSPVYSPTLCNPVDYSSPGSSVHGVL